jgi:ribosomal protein S18 acetylase RimI-like enzyme
MKSHSPDIRPIRAGETHELRQQVLRPDAPLSKCAFLGDDAQSTIHFGVFKATEMVGVASLYEESSPDVEHQQGWRIRGMATDASVRGFGYGKKLLEACLAHAREHGGDVVWCNARTSAVGFYEKNGFSIVGEEFDIPGIGPHFLMVKLFQ